MHRAALLLALLPASVLAASFADLNLIEREVTLFTGARAGEAGGALLPLDRRLRLAACALPHDLSWRSARRDTVVVLCPDVGGWRIFVPVRAQSLAPMPEAPAAVAITRGEAVTVAVEGEGFSISRSGEALEAGPVGAWIRVRTGDNSGPRGEPLRAQVVRPGLVRVPL